MKKRLLLTGSLLLTLFALHAQNPVPPATPGQIFFYGHIIRIYKTPTGGYGYDIFYQNRMLVHQFNDPFTGVPGGLKNKEDAFKVAKWQVLHLNPVGRQMTLGPRPIPKEVAHQLNIATN